MKLEVRSTTSSVVVELHFSFITDSEFDEFLDKLPSWVYARLEKCSPHFFADLPLSVINDHLPYGILPCRYLWDVFLDALYSVTFSYYDK